MSGVGLDRPRFKKRILCSYFEALKPKNTHTKMEMEGLLYTELSSLFPEGEFTKQMSGCAPVHWVFIKYKVVLGDFNVHVDAVVLNHDHVYSR